MTDAQAAAHGIVGAAQVAHSETIENYDSSYGDDAGFGTDLRHGMESSPDGDNDTDDIGSYPPVGGFRRGGDTY